MAGQRQIKVSKWRENATLMISAASLLSTGTIGFFTYRTDARAKGFEAAGYLETAYYGVDLRNYCDTLDNKDGRADPATPPGEGADSEDRHFDLNDGYVQNDVWLELKRRLNRSCAAVELVRGDNDMGQGTDSPDYKAAEKQLAREDLVDGFALVYLIVSSKTSAFDINPVLEEKTVPFAPGTPVWDYAARDGTTERMPLGMVRPNTPVRIPIAIVSDRKPVVGPVLVPDELSWTSPISGEAARRPVPFVISGRYWRSIRVGVTAS